MKNSEKGFASFYVSLFLTDKAFGTSKLLQKYAVQFVSLMNQLRKAEVGKETGQENVGIIPPKRSIPPISKVFCGLIKLNASFFPPLVNCSWPARIPYRLSDIIGDAISTLTQVPFVVSTPPESHVLSDTVLLPFQKRSLTWMLAREHVTGGELQDPITHVVQSPLWREYKLPRGFSVFFNIMEEKLSVFFLCTT